MTTKKSSILMTSNINRKVNKTNQLLICAQQYYAEGKHIEAEKICKQIIDKHKKSAEAYNILGLVYYTKKEFGNAIYNFKKAINFTPTNALFFYNIAFAYLGENTVQNAIRSLQAAITHNEQCIPAYLTLSSIYLANARYQEAEQTLNKTLQMQPHLEKAEEMLGTVYESIGKSEKAKVCYQNVLLQNNKNITALINLGKIYTQAGFLQQGLMFLLQAKELEPNNANLHINLGCLWLSLSKLKEAKNAFLEAIKLDPYRLSAFVNYTLTINTIGESFTAKNNFEQLLSSPDKYYVTNTESASYLLNKAKVGLALTYCYTCDFEKLENYKSSIIELLLENIANHGFPIIVPFHTVMLNLPWDIIRTATAYYVQHQLDKKDFVFAENEKSACSITNTCSNEVNQKIRIAYLSPDFGDHAVGLLVRGLFQFHDHTKFVIYALSLRNLADKYTDLIKNSVDYFIDLSNDSDEAIIKAIQQLNIDVLIDLAGYTIGSKPAVVMAKLAKKQVNWLGYPYTTENLAVDYFISNNVLTPPDLHRHFAEKIINLPNAWFACEPFEPLEQLPIVARANYNLPEDAFIFCCFSRAYRFSKQLFNCWAQILQQVPHSVLWLHSEGKELDNCLHERFKLLGIEPNRLIFSTEERMSIHWRHRLADLWLDPLNVTTGTGSILCVWAEVPVITLAGETSQSRVGATILTAAGLDSLIVTTEQEYINLAVKLALDRDYYWKIKEQLKLAKRSNLFQPAKFIAELEQVYCEILITNP